jgi:hypothetical protein
LNSEEVNTGFGFKCRSTVGIICVSSEIFANLSHLFAADIAFGHPYESISAVRTITIANMSFNLEVD